MRKALKLSQPVTPGTAGQVAPEADLERVRAELREALERQTAITEILRVISVSPTDVQRVLDAIAASAAKYVGADDVTVFIVRGDRAVISAHIGPVPVSGSEVGTSGPLIYSGSGAPTISVPIDLSTVTGAAILERRLVHVPDVRATDNYPRSREFSFRDVPSQRAVVAAPLLHAGEVLGAISLIGYEPHAFSDQQIELVQTFADQAVIAIENARLFNETKEALERQSAVSEVLKVIGRSPFAIHPVFETVIESAVRLTAADWGLIFRFSGERLQLVAGSSRARPEFIEYLQREGVALDRGSASGRAALERRSIHIHDVLADAEYRLTDVVMRLAGNRTLLAVPMLREGSVVGVVAVDRSEVKPFTDGEIALIETFADQAAIAIENVRLFSEIEEKSRQLEAASRHKSEFLANMSHELRTPLNAVIGFSEVLLQKMFGELNEQQTDYVRDIAGSGRHLLDLVNEILDLSKIEAGRMELEPSEFDLANTISGAVMFVRERAGRHSIELASDVPDDLGTVVADERKVRQVLLNLLSNAVKFTPDGGAIGVRARRGDGQVEVSVSDTGIGISPEDQPRVFEEFQQVGKPTDRSREGTGLGLTLAKRFVELHGGRIWLDSEVGKGTTFNFAIPTSTRPGTSA